MTRVSSSRPALRISSGASGSGSSDGSAKRGGMVVKSSVCTFWLARAKYAIDAAYVQEVVAVARTVPVPLVAASVLGMFNLRGVPTPLVDLATILELGATPRARGDVAALAMILVGRGLSVAARIDASDRVIAIESDVRIVAAADEPLIGGFLDLSARGEAAVPVLDADIVFDRIESLRVRKRSTA
jgi:chemotaxis signal transduction protein